ncbi:Trafficking protein particle complex subunit 12 [Rhodotorula toruloides]|nr:Trafficking protein particle complex subunit 12 [Rhodotorula toruloides]
MQSGTPTPSVPASQPYTIASPPHQSSSLQSPPLPPLPPSEGVPSGAPASYTPFPSTETRHQLSHDTLPPPVPASPPSINRQQSLAETLKELQEQAAFVPRSSVVRTAAANVPIAVSTVVEPEVGVEESVSELYIAGLTARELFVRLPESDDVSLLLEKYLRPEHRPARDLSGEWRGKTLNELIATHNWRGVARYSYDAVTQSPPEQTAYILSHWLLRFQALVRLRLFQPLAVELASVTSLLPPSSCFGPVELSEPSEADIPLFHPAVPFELHVLVASLPSLQGQQSRSVELVTMLIRSCKEALWAAKKESKEADQRIWTSRVERLGVLLAGLFAEVKASPSASSLLSSATSPSSAVLSALCRLGISAGEMTSLDRSLSATPAEDPAKARRRIQILRDVADGKYVEAEVELRRLVDEDADDVEARTNLAVVLLYLARVEEATTHLISLLSTHPHIAYNSPTILFNLCTLFEISTEHATAKKVGLLRDAARYGAQGIERGCFKLK